MSTPDVYQFHAWLRGLSPIIWRRLLLRSDQILADLHYALQISFGWSGFHLHRFRIYGWDFGVSRLGDSSFHQNVNQVRLAECHFRLGERFFYEYDFSDTGSTRFGWNAFCHLCPRRPTLFVSAERRSTPPEDCGGVAAFPQRQDEAPGRAQELLDQIADCVRERDGTTWQDLLEEISTLETWLTLPRFDRRQVNRELPQHALQEAR